MDGRMDRKRGKRTQICLPFSAARRSVLVSIRRRLDINARVYHGNYPRRDTKIHYANPLP